MINKQPITAVTYSLFLGYLNRGYTVEEMSKETGRPIEVCERLIEEVKEMGKPNTDSYKPSSYVIARTVRRRTSII
jgi:hypothetical protein